MVDKNVLEVEARPLPLPFGDRNHGLVKNSSRCCGLGTKRYYLGLWTKPLAISCLFQFCVFAFLSAVVTPICNNYVKC